MAEVLSAFQLHVLLQEMQKQHGVSPHQDYEQYRQYCTRRLQRLRKHNDSSKYLKHGSGNRGKSGSIFARRPHINGLNQEKPSGSEVSEDVDSKEEGAESHYENVTHEDFLIVLLVHTERCWGFAMEYKAKFDALINGISVTDKTSPSKLRRFYLGKLKKAKLYASELLEMATHLRSRASEDEASSVSFSECEAYAAWIHGVYALETQAFSDAVKNFGTCWLRLRNIVGDDSDVLSPELKEYLSARAEFIVQPLYQFCLYEWQQSDDAGNEDVTNIVAQVGDLQSASATERSSTGGDTSEYSSVVYRDVKFGVSSANLKRKLAEMDKLEASFNAKPNDESNFTNLLSSFQDATDVLANDLSMTSNEAQQHTIRCLQGYIEARKNRSMVKHYESIMVRDTTKLQDRKLLEETAHLYDMIVQISKADLRLVPPEMEDGAEGAALEDEFMLETNAHILRYRAHKCFFTAHIYVHLNKYAEAAALLGRAKSLGEQAYEELQACEVDDGILQEVARLNEEEIPISEATLKAAAFLASKGKLAATGAGSKGRYLIEHVREYRSAKAEDGTYKLYEIPPPLQYIPCKPAFYDIALNHVSDLADLQPIIDANSNKKSAGGGLFGWLRG